MVVRWIPCGSILYFLIQIILVKYFIAVKLLFNLPKFILFSSQVHIWIIEN